MEGFKKRPVLVCEECEGLQYVNVLTEDGKRSLYYCFYCDKEVKLVDYDTSRDLMYTNLVD